jgi:hypothetical protein
MPEIQISKKNYSKEAEKIQEIPLSEINISTQHEILMESLNSFQTNIDLLHEKIKLTTSFLKNDQFELAETMLIDMTDSIHNFINLVSIIHKNLIIDSDKRMQSGQTIKQLEIHLLSVFKGIFYAQQKRDYVILMDLLEHELKDNLTQWKILAIPQIKKLNQA